MIDFEARSDCAKGVLQRRVFDATDLRPVVESYRRKWAYIFLEIVVFGQNAIVQRPTTDLL